MSPQASIDFYGDDILDSMTLSQYYDEDSLDMEELSQLEDELMNSPLAGLNQAAEAVNGKPSTGSGKAAGPTGKAMSA